MPKPCFTTANGSGVASLVNNGTLDINAEQVSISLGTSDKGTTITLAGGAINFMGRIASTGGTFSTPWS